VKQRSFYLYLFLTTVVVFVLLLLLTLGNNYKTYLSFALVVNTIFAFTSIPMYYLFTKLALSPKRTLFISATVGNMFFRIFLSVMILVLYFLWYNPDDGNFVVPFLVVYVTFTIFETYILLRIADRKPK
jgi:hypothetical protein